MPQPKNSTDYPPEYEQTVLAIDPDIGLEILTPSVRHANAFRMSFYGYFTALKREGKRADLIAKINNTVIVLEGAKVRFVARQDTWAAQLIRANLGLTRGAAPPPAPTPLSIAQGKLAEIRKAKEDAARQGEVRVSDGG